MSALRTRLTERAWELDWPQAPSGVHAPATPWVEALNLQPFEKVEDKWKELSQRQFTQVVALLNGQTAAPVPQAVVHRHLDALTAWNAAVLWQATWPPTLEGFGKALLKSQDRDPGSEELLGLALVLHAYPDLAWSAIQTLPVWARKSLPAAWFEPAVAPVMTTPVAPSAHQPTPVGRSPVPEASAGQEPVAVTDAPRAPRAPRANPAANWLTEQLHLQVASMPPALRRQQLGTALKNYHNQTAQARWFEEVLFPAMAAQAEPDVAVLIRDWPGLRYEVTDPVAWVKTGAFWAQLRDAPVGVQPLLMTQLLPEVVQSDTWSDDTRLRMLRFMVSYAKTDRVAFEQRLGLWQAWGGQLEQGGTLSSEDEGIDTGLPSVFEVPRTQTTALDWLRQQKVPMWTAWADEQAHPAPASPSTLASRPRRPGR